ncbi:hypothetical protein X566_23655 [Afipia sp. P52-10]|nr:hypothetical protein X566_23655 [Afipia sp. P52-10]
MIALIDRFDANYITMIDRRKPSDCRRMTMGFPMGAGAERDASLRMNVAGGAALGRRR